MFDPVLFASTITSQEFIHTSENSEIIISLGQSFYELSTLFEESVKIFYLKGIESLLKLKV